MINNSQRTTQTRKRALCLALLLLVSPILTLSAEGAPRYKKNTVVDFEGALVEGKSRKPYSTYLTQQKQSAFENLYQWSPDLDKGLQDTKQRVDVSL